MTIPITKCFKCDHPLSPLQKAMQKSHCTYCEAIVKGEEEGKRKEGVAKSLHNANRKVMR